MKRFAALALLSPAVLLAQTVTLTPNPLAPTTATVSTVRTVTVPEGAGLLSPTITSVVVVPSLAPAPNGTSAAITNVATAGADLVLTLGLSFPSGTTYRINFQFSTAGAGTLTGSVDIQVAAPPLISTTPMPNGQVGVTYVATTVTISNGLQPFTIGTSGNFPPGLTLTPSTNSFTVSGTPTTPGTYTWSAVVTDASGVQRTRSYTVVIAAAPLAVSTTSLPAGVFNTAYGPVNLAATGGVAPYTWSIDPGPTLHNGLTLSSGGAISGTPLQAGSRAITFRVTDSQQTPATATATLTLNVTAPTLSVNAVTLPTGTRTVAYNATFTATGGVPGYTFAVTQGALPPGLTLASGGALTGTPTQTGTFNFTVQATDTQPVSAQRVFSITVIDPPQITSPANLPAGVQNSSYYFAFSATGGQAPYTWERVGEGPLPAGLTLGSNGQLTGTPTTQQTRTFMVRVTDALNNTAEAPFTLVIGPALQIVTAALPNGAVGAPYNLQLLASGGVPPYYWSLLQQGEVQPSVAPGLTLSESGLISGTPLVAGTTTFTVLVYDDRETSRQRTFTLTIGSSLAITSTTLPAGTRGTPYSANLTGSGGTQPYNWALVGGGLPPGLSLSSAGAVTGTPTDSGNFTFNVRLSDPNGSVTGQVSISIGDAPISIAASNLPAGRVGRSYSGAIRLEGGGVAIFDLTGGSLPPGLSLLPDGNITGTPTSAGTFNFSVRAGSGTASDSRSFSIQILPPPPSVTTDSLPEGTVNTPYTGSVGFTGGVAPVRLSATGLPAGLTMSEGGSITGTPTEEGQFQVAVTATDSTNESSTRNVLLRIRTPLVDGLTLVDGVVGRSYVAALVVSGGAPPYTFALIGGLPPGLTLESTGRITGTPTAEGTFRVEFRVTDSGNRVITSTTDLRVRPELAIAAPGIVNNEVPPGLRGGTFNFAFEATGGLPPYAWSMEGAPAGLVIDPVTGRVTGSPTRAGTFNITITLVDNGGRTSRTYRLVVESDLALPAQTLPDGVLGTAYSATLNRTGGNPPYTFSIETGSLPTGISLTPEGNLTGTPTQSGTFNFTARVDDGDSAAASRLYALT
ncbi:MAG: Ig domain-containing protein, partial [Bryobacteraceae bacterium]|nr:Ig domain-containing protein [Bryobacteraceae bacterium]